MYNHEEKNIPVKITISIGVSSFSHLTINAQKLIENADKALYNAKIRRNMVFLFDGIDEV